jgi:hypothetical protein
VGGRADLEDYRMPAALIAQDGAIPSSFLPHKRGRRRGGAICVDSKAEGQNAKSGAHGAASKFAAKARPSGERGFLLAERERAEAGEAREHHGPGRGLGDGVGAAADRADAAEVESERIRVGACAPSVNVSSAY